NRLRILGMTDEEITRFNDTGAVSPHMTIYSPLAGTVIQRKVGPGQYINTSSQNTSASDPTFIIGDLSTVWLVAYVRESEAPHVHVGQAAQFKVLAYPNRTFSANISYVATSLDTGTRRLLVRATIDNSQNLLRPEMFAHVKIVTAEGDSSLGVPREAIVYDGKSAHVWIARGDQSVERREIKTGQSNGQMVEVLDGLRHGESVISKGTLFVDRAARGSLPSMLRTLMSFCLSRRLLVLAAYVAFIGIGFATLKALNVEAYPDPAPPIIKIIAQYPGQSPEEVERYVTIPLEIAVASTPGLTYIRSNTVFALGFIRLQFEYGRDYNFVRQQVTN